VVEVFVSKLGLDSAQNSFVVILQERNGERILPIWIGRPEAESIAAHLNGIRRERPMTHDLAQALVVTLGGQLQRVNVTRVHEGTFYAELHLLKDGTPHVVDARPSDSIAIALRLNAPIFAAEHLLAEYELPAESAEAGAGEASEESAGSPEAESESVLERHRKSADQLKRHLEQLRPEDFGKFTL
jgi:hypothetical protein